jgi:hypothetical protein
MIKRLFKKQVKRKMIVDEPDFSGNYLVVTINDKVMPVLRGEIYADPLHQFLKENQYGEVSGGGTRQLPSGEIENCEIEISLERDNIDDALVKEIIKQLEKCGAPKGSFLFVENTGDVISFGVNEGIGIYIDSINQQDDVYKNIDAKALANEIIQIANLESSIIRSWQGKTEIGYYFYGKSFENIRNSIETIIQSNPVYKTVRLNQIA